MFKPLASLSSYLKIRVGKKRSEKITLDFLVTQLTIPPVNQRYFIATGKNGRATSVTTKPKGLLLTFERKIGSDDLQDGKLLPIVFQDIKRRGGKRIAALHISLETAEDLHALLGRVLQQERKRTMLERFFDRTWEYMANMKTYPSPWSGSRA